MGARLQTVNVRGKTFHIAGVHREESFALQVYAGRTLRIAVLHRGECFKSSISLCVGELLNLQCAHARENFLHRQYTQGGSLRFAGVCRYSNSHRGCKQGERSESQTYVGVNVSNRQCARARENFQICVYAGERSTSQVYTERTFYITGVRGWITSHRR